MVYYGIYGTLWYIYGTYALRLGPERRGCAAAAVGRGSGDRIMQDQDLQVRDL